MTHIAIDARIINSSTGTYVERLLHYLQNIDSKNTYTIIVRSADKDFWHPTAKNFSVIDTDVKDYSFREQTVFKHLLDTLSPDLVHFCMPQQPILYSGKKVTTIHDLTLLKEYNSDKNYFKYKFKQLIGKYVFRKVAHDSEFVIVPTEYTKRDVVDFAQVPSSKVMVTYESADVAVHGVKKPDLPFSQYIINIGNHSDFKNVVRLAEAHQQLLQKYPKLGLLFVCRKTPAREITEALVKKRQYKNIHFAGLSDAERDYALAHALAYVTPSLREGFGLTGIEAMGSGVAVLSSNATCLPEVYADGAVYFDPLNIDEMTEKIDKVLSDETFRKDLIRRGLARHKFFSWEKMAQETLAVYEAALAT